MTVLFNDLKVHIQQYYQVQATSLMFGFYVGIITMLILLNLGYFVNFRNKTFAANFFLFVAVLSLTLVYHLNYERVQNLAEILMIFCSGLFLKVHCRTPKKIRMNKFLAGAYATLLSAVIIDFFTHNKLQLVGYLSVAIFGFFGVMSFQIRKTAQLSRSFLIGYALLLGIVMLHFVSYDDFVLSDILVGVSILGMIILTFNALVHVKNEQVQIDSMRQQIIGYSHRIESLESFLEEKEQLMRNALVLSVREKEILHLIAQNKSNKTISDELFISVNTVKHHIKNIYDKLEINNRSDAVDKWSNLDA